MKNENRSNEHAMRRPDWKGDGVLIRLADGREWTLAQPRVRPLLNASGITPEWMLGLTPDPELGVTIEAIFASVQTGRDDLAIATVPLTAVAIMCLQRNYTLRTNQAAWLISGRFLERGDVAGSLGVLNAIRDQLVAPIRRDLANVLAGPPRLRLGFDQPFEIEVPWRSSQLEQLDQRARTRSR